jgi:glycosyltransferase involved in cell wall biosynthesis
MKIAHIVCTYPPYFGGMGNVVFQMAEHLVAAGHEVEVLTPMYYENKEIRSPEAESARTHAPEVEEQIATVNRIAPTFQYGNAARLPQIGHELDDFDVVHLHYPFFGTANLVRRWKLNNPNKPLVITYHMDNRSPGWKGLIFKLYSKYWMPKILGAADAIIASTFDYVQSGDARKIFEEDPSKWHEIPFGVDTNRFFPAPKPELLFEEFQLDINIPTVLFVGGMDSAHYFKGIPVLLQALFALKKNNFPVQAVLVGDGELRENYELQVKALGLEKNVFFMGRVDDEMLPVCYTMADLFVLPSINQGEAFGMVLLEAMASGVPVLATDLAGVRSVAKYGGQVVPVNDPIALATSIKEFLNDPEQIQFWKERSRLSAEEVFSWDSIIARTVDLYESLQKK